MKYSTSRASFLLVVSWLTVLHARKVKRVSSLTEDASLTVPQLITKNGYPVEVHTVTTHDGYLLTLHRIPGSPKCQPGPRKNVALLNHCFLCSSFIWIALGPGKALAYLLADEGFDVWLGNVRGNTYSQNHTRLSTKDTRYWDFSWHEHGVLDVPAMVDYILEETSQKDLYYFGHSMGCTMSLVMLSERPEYNEKMKAVFYMAPYAFGDKSVRSLLKYVAPIFSPVQTGARLIGYGKALSGRVSFNGYVKSVCQLSQAVCLRSIFSLLGPDEEQVSKEKIPYYLSHLPDDTSIRTLMHIGQVLTTLGTFRQYDWGRTKNKQMYGSRFPPPYDLRQVKAKAYIYYGLNDWLATPKMAKAVGERLRYLVKIYEVKNKKFNHIDFIWAKDADKLLFKQVMNDVRSVMGNRTRNSVWCKRN